MKKIILFISLFFTSVLITNATPCKVISGDGTHIGDEIQCGTENFYVLSNDGENIEMLAKYNLYVGSTYYKVEFEQTFDVYKDADEYWDENYADEYDGRLRELINENNEFYGVLAYNYIEYDEVKQNEESIGAHGDLKVEPLFPEVGVYNYFVVENDLFYENYLVPGVASEDGYTDFEINLSSTEEALILDWLFGYQETLNDLNIEVRDMTILSVADINSLVYEVTGKELPLEEWYDNRYNWGKVNSDYYHDAVVVGSIKEQLPEGYEWLWSTTFWTRTKNSESSSRLYFVDTTGDLCNDYYCGASVGAGIRPVVTIPASLIYQIETKTDGNGTVEADHIEAENGTVVKFTVTPKEGFKLKEVKVTDANGNVVIFKDYTFTMPNANVTIEAIFEPENPNTVDIILITFATLLISGITLTYINYRKTKLR